MSISLSIPSLVLTHARYAPDAYFEVGVHHTQCGPEGFADEGFQSALRGALGIDVSGVAVSDHDTALCDDFERLGSAREIPGRGFVSGYIYDVAHGTVREQVAPARLRP